MSPTFRIFVVSLIFIILTAILTGCNQIKFMDYLEALKEDGQISKLTITDKKLQVQMK